VSLDEQAVRLVEYQRAYESTAKLVTILDQLTRNNRHDSVKMVRDSQVSPMINSINLPPTTFWRISTAHKPGRSAHSASSAPACV